MTVVALNADTAACTKKNYVVPGPSSVAAAIATRAIARYADVAKTGNTIALGTPAVDADTVKYSQTLSALG